MQTSTVDYRLLASHSALVLCSRCFQHGVATPVPQLISPHHRVSNLCRGCASEQATGTRRPVSQLVKI